MGAQMFKKYVTSLIIICYRSVVRHPFLLGMILFVFSMYRMFPFLFSVVVSASPVVVSTAVLLGTLLSYGQPNLPEMEVEIEPERGSGLESEGMGRTEIVEREDETNGSRIEVANKLFEERSKIDDDDIVDDDNMVDDGLLEFGEVDEEKVVLGSRYTPLQQTEDDHIVLESDKLWEGSADPLNSNSGLLWKGVEGNGGGDDKDEDEDEDGDDDGSDSEDSGDSGSDGAESSSPDASMADIIPMLDELHPLLSEEQETREPSHMSDDGNDAVLEHSVESSDTSSESNDDAGIGNNESLKVGDGEDGGKDLEHVEKEDDTRSAITWTEYDQKNLMNLGTSEMERNRRLENLIARRRARKTMRMQAEKNLIDLESADLPWNIPPISTSRNNPFDYDANDDIPGSAPSVLLKRRNPFDLPYDSSEEKPDLVGEDTFQQEFAVFQPKEPIFRRHESFNVGPSVFAASRTERQETKLKPYFVPERSFATFQRQFSGLSDSKASSVPDTESVTSDLENKDHIEEAEHASEIDQHVSDHDHVSHERPYFVPEHVASDDTGFTFQRQLSEVSDSKMSSEPDTESVSSADDFENKDHIDLSLEPDLISLEAHERASEIIEDLSEHVSMIRESFDEAEISVTNQQELHSSGSSLSSLDEASEQIYNEKEGDEEATGSVSETNYFLDRDNSIERSEIDVTSLLVEESQPNEPVYDLSPRSVTRNLSNSSILIDLHKDETFLHADDPNQSPSSASDVKWNFTDPSFETGNAQTQLPVVPDIEEHVLPVDNISTFIPNEPVFEAEDVVLDSSASHEVDMLGFHQEDVTSQLDEESLLGRYIDKPLAEDLEEQQARRLEHGEVALPSYEAQFSEVVHGETYENEVTTYGEALSQPQKESLLLDTNVNEPSEDNLEALQVQHNSYNLDNLQLQEPDVVEATDLETKAQEIPAYASDTYSIENNVGDVDEINEIDEDLLVELDAVGDFSVNDFGSSSNEMKKDPRTDEDSFSRDLGSTFSEVKQVYDIETKRSGDEDSDSDLETTLDERNQGPSVSDHDLVTMISGDEVSYSKVLESTVDEMKQDAHASDHDLESRDTEEMKHDPPTFDVETKHFEDEDTYSKDAALGEIKQDPHALDHDLETKHSEHEVSNSKDEMKEAPHGSNHDLEVKHSEDEDSYSKDAILDDTKQHPLDSNHDLESKHSENEDSYSTDAVLDEIKQGRQDSNDLDTKLTKDEESYPKNLGSTLDDVKQDRHALNQDLETNHSIDEEDSYSADLDNTFNDMKKGTYALEHRLETFYSVDDNFYSKHVESTFNEMKQDLHASFQDFETNGSGETHVKMDAEVMQSQNENENEDDISNTKVEGAFQAEASKLKLISDANASLLPQETETTTSLASSSSGKTVSHKTEYASSTSNTNKE